MKSGKVSRKFDILRMIYAAYKNEDQGKPSTTYPYNYKKYNNLRSLLSGFPKDFPFNAFKQFLEIHDILNLPVGSNAESTTLEQSDTCFDFQNTLFNGPFIDDEDYTCLIMVEQRNNLDKPRFDLIWYENGEKKDVYIMIYDSHTASKEKYLLTIGDSKIILRLRSGDIFASYEALGNYVIDSDGFLCK